MKTLALFRIGALAAMAAALGNTLLSLLWFAFGNAAITTPRVWFDFVVDGLFVCGLVALYVAQAERAGTLGLSGFVLLIFGLLFSAADSGQTMGITTGIVTPAQVLQSQQDSTFVMFNMLLHWFWILGDLAFGWATVRAGVFPRWVGVLLVLVGVVNLFTGLATVAQYLFAVLALAAWGGLGWSLWQYNGKPLARPTERAATA